MAYVSAKAVEVVPGTHRSEPSNSLTVTPLACPALPSLTHLARYPTAGVTVSSVSASPNSCSLVSPLTVTVKYTSAVAIAGATWQVQVCLRASAGAAVMISVRYCYLLWR